MRTPPQPESPPTSAPEGNPDLSGASPDIRAPMSGIGGKLPLRQTWSEQPILAINGPSNLDKIFVGRTERGFDFLGYHFSRSGLRLAEATIKKFVGRIEKGFDLPGLSLRPGGPHHGREDHRAVRRTCAPALRAGPGEALRLFQVWNIRQTVGRLGDRGRYRDNAARHIRSPRHRVAVRRCARTWSKPCYNPKQ